MISFSPFIHYLDFCGRYCPFRMDELATRPVSTSAHKIVLTDATILLLL